MTIQEIKEHLLLNKEFDTEYLMKNGKIIKDEQHVSSTKQREQCLSLYYGVKIEGEDYCDSQVLDEVKKVFKNCFIINHVPYDYDRCDGYIRVYTEIYLAIIIKKTIN